MLAQIDLQFTYTLTHALFYRMFVEEYGGNAICAHFLTALAAAIRTQVRSETSCELIIDEVYFSEMSDEYMHSSVHIICCLFAVSFSAEQMVLTFKADLSDLFLQRALRRLPVAVRRQETRMTIRAAETTRTNRHGALDPMVSCWAYIVMRCPILQRSAVQTQTNMLMFKTTPLNPRAGFVRTCARD